MSAVDAPRKCQYFGGVTGCSDKSEMVLVQSDGKILAWSEGGPTNQLVIGVDECLRRVNQMATEVKRQAGLPEDTTLKGLGLSLSGGDEEKAQQELKAGIKSQYPRLAKTIFVGSDTHGALATALTSGGVVLIAGTSSNCQLFNPDCSTFRCGGWGHLMGDEGSAYWISQKAMKIYFDHEDNLIPSPYDVSYVKAAMQEYFGIEDRANLLSYLYSQFDKAKIAGLSVQLSKELQEPSLSVEELSSQQRERGAIENKDALCCSIFSEAGQVIAEHILALAPKINKALLSQTGGLHVVCIGSVFESWRVIQPGFERVMQVRGPKAGITEITFLRLQTSAALGAAALGAKAASFTLPLDHSAFAKTFYTAKYN